MRRCKNSHSKRKVLKLEDLLFKIRFQLSKCRLCSSAGSRWCKRFKRFVLFCFLLLLSCTLPWKKHQPLLFFWAFSFLQCATFTTVKKVQTLLKHGRQRDTVFPVFSPDTTEGTSCRLKLQACSSLRSVTSLQTRPVRGEFGVIEVSIRRRVWAGCPWLTATQSDWRVPWPPVSSAGPRCLWEWPPGPGRWWWGRSRVPRRRRWRCWPWCSGKGFLGSGPKSPWCLLPARCGTGIWTAGGDKRGVISGKSCNVSREQHHITYTSGMDISCFLAFTCTHILVPILLVLLHHFMTITWPQVWLVNHISSMVPFANALALVGDIKADFLLYCCNFTASFVLPPKRSFQTMQRMSYI